MQQIKSVEMSDALQVSWKLDTNQNQKPQSIKEEEMEEENQNSKYKLRASSKKRNADGEKGMPKKRGPKPRIRTQPMSKYRRKTANARERSRMGEINGAFEHLRDKIPNPIVQKGKCEKLTKINILHVAINYINALENILETGEPGVQIYGTSLIKSPFKTEGESDSNDSGMVEDESSQCPRWEELQSTLDLNSKKTQQQSPPPASTNKKRPGNKKAKLGSGSKSDESDPTTNFNWKYNTPDQANYHQRHQQQIFGHNNNVFSDFRVNKQHSGTLPFIKQEPNLNQPQPQHQPRILQQQQQQHHGFPNSAQQQHQKHQQLHHRQPTQNSHRRFPQNQVLKQMPTNLPSKQGILHELNPSCVRKPVTLSSRTEKVSCSPVNEVKKPLPEPCIFLNLGTEIFSDLCSSDTDDLFSDLNSSFDSFEDFSDINFVNEDQFPVFI